MADPVCAHSATSIHLWEDWRVSVKRDARGTVVITLECEVHIGAYMSQEFQLAMSDSLARQLRLRLEELMLGPAPIVPAMPA